MKTVLGDNIGLRNDKGVTLIVVTLRDSIVSVEVPFQDLNGRLSNLLTRSTYCDWNGVFTLKQDIDDYENNFTIEFTYWSIDSLVPIMLLDNYPPKDEEEAKLLLTRIVANIDLVVEQTLGITREVKLEERASASVANWTEVG